MNRLLSSPLMIFVYVFSAIAGVFVGFTFGGATFGVPLAVLLAFGFVLAIATVEIIFRRKTAGSIEPSQDLSPIQEVAIVGGKIIDNIDEVPDEVKKVYQQLLQDADADGVLDLFQREIKNEETEGSINADQLHELREAKHMLESGLITRDEYQATVKQILDDE